MAKIRELINKLQKYSSDERGTIVLGFTLMLVPIYLSIAALWNTSSLVEQKIQAQSMADAAAHSIASDISATINEMTMLNMLLLRAKSANGIFTACSVSSAAGATMIAINTAEAVSEMADPFTFPKGVIDMALAVWDAARIGRFIAEYTRTGLSSIANVINKCEDRQQTLYNSFGSNINQHLKHIEQYLNHNDPGGNWNIYATMSKSSLYPVSTSHPPFLKKSSLIEKTILVGPRLLLQDEQWLNVSNPFSLDDPKGSSITPPPTNPTKTTFFDGFRSNNTGRAMRIAWVSSIAGSTGIYAAGNWGYDLTTRTTLSEWNINSSSDRRIFQVLVFVERTEKNNSFMAKGFFKPFGENTILAASQAEAVNSYDEMLHYSSVGKLPVIKQILSLILKMPWRLWTSLGANYQPRLTSIDHDMFNSLTSNTSNAKMKSALENNTGLSGSDISAKKLNGAFLH